jgi:ribosomal-protein-alanine N-acetyltransferase
VAVDAPGPVLIGSIGFKGPPNAAGEVEIGYSVLPQYQGTGYATEMASAVIGWAGASGRVWAVLAQTTADNLGSRRVLAKLGFVAAGAGEEPGSTLYRLAITPAAAPN